MKPDVIVNSIGQTVVFQARSKRVCNWLCEQYGLTTENLNGHTEFRIQPGRCKRIVEELRAEGLMFPLCNPKVAESH